MKKWRSIIALVLVILLFLGMVATIVTSFVAYGDEVSDMQNELDAIAAKKERLEKELESLKNKTNVALEEKAIIDQQIAELDKEKLLLDASKADLEVLVEESRIEKEAAQTEYDEYLQLAKERIRSMYELGQASYLGLVLGSDSIEDFTTRHKMAQQMDDYDQKIIGELKDKKEDIDAKTLALETALGELETTLTSLEQNEASLKKKQSQSQSLINTFNKKSEENLKAIEAAEKAEEELQAEIREALLNSTNNMTFDGKFLWPVDGFYTITDVFGMRTHPITGVYKLHSGVDIAGSGIRGKTIRAAANGVVLKAGYHSAYGNYVVLDHGDGFSTLYAHASSLNVSAGQTVARGDTLGKVGSTGYSTGAHLHFVVMNYNNRNNKHYPYENPLNYFDGYNFRYV